MVELGVVEQRYQAVLEVLQDGVPIVEVAARFGVTRQSVHRWLKRYAAEGLAVDAPAGHLGAACSGHLFPRVCGDPRRHP